jgi:GAF domain-containing protein
VRYPNLGVQAPAGFDIVGRTYKSFVAVPVRAGDEKIGLLTVDSDEVDVFTDVEEGYLRLLGGLLAAGVSHVRLTASAAGTA